MSQLLDKSTIARCAWSALAVLACSGASVTETVHALLNDPASAQTFDYCAWVHGPEDLDEVLTDVDAILADGSSSSAGRKLASAILIDAGVATARSAASRKHCSRDMQKGAKLFSATLRKQARTSRKSGGFQQSDQPDIAAIQVDLSRLWIRDQAARASYLRLQTKQTGGAAYWAYRLSVAETVQVDLESVAFMQRVLGQFDWIDNERFGTRSSRQAWLLVQHADDFPALQELALARMKPYLERNRVSARDYAYLWDRVAVNAGRLQRYGTQPTWECSAGALTLHPMEDPDRVDERRAAMGLGPAAIDLAEMARNTCF